MSSKSTRFFAQVAGMLAILALLITPAGAFAAGPTVGTIAVGSTTSAKGPSNSPHTPSGPGVETIAEGLNSPRHMAFGPEGALYVAEAGVGGSGACRETPEGGEQCYGPSGSILRINLRKASLPIRAPDLDRFRIAKDLPSFGPNGAIGAHDISFQGRGNAFILTGLGANPADRATYGPDGMNFGRIARMLPMGSYRYGTDISGFEAAANPDGGEVDSNPYGLLALPDDVKIVADAGANALLKVDGYGDITVLAVFLDRLIPAPFPGLPDPFPMQAVPTSVTLGPDGYLYVSQLTGFPFPAGAANIYRVPMGGGDPEVAYSGFTAVVDIAFGPDGSLYVAQISDNLAAPPPGAPGSLIKVAPDGTRSTIFQGPVLGGVEVGPDGAVYVTTGAVFPGGGTVVRITQ